MFAYDLDLFYFSPFDVMLYSLIFQAQHRFTEFGYLFVPIVLSWAKTSKDDFYYVLNLNRVSQSPMNVSLVGDVLTSTWYMVPWSTQFLVHGGIVWFITVLFNNNKNRKASELYLNLYHRIINLSYCWNVQRLTFKGPYVFKFAIYWLFIWLLFFLVKLSRIA